jgi:hypothetical protein
MKLNKRIEILSKLGDYLQSDDDYLNAVIHRTHYNNLWFTPENQKKAIHAIAQEFLNREKLKVWAANYSLNEIRKPKTIGLVMAGNLPLVGFHDLLCVFASGNKSLIKLSDKDKFLLPHLIEVLRKIEPETSPFFEIVDVIKDFDAVIATGSNNSARYFEAYFGKYPHIIRKNRNGIAVLDGTESQEDLHLLGKDVFRFFGLGCRNVSKLYIPEGYDFQPLLEVLHEYREIILHDKYKNNFDYNLALVVLNRTVHFNNGCIILVENPAIASRIALLHYSHYSNLSSLEQELKLRKNEIQCVVSKTGLLNQPTIQFGQSQQPSLFDYPDGVDVMEFLAGLT